MPLWLGVEGQTTLLAITSMTTRNGVTLAKLYILALKVEFLSSLCMHTRCTGKRVYVVLYSVKY